MAQCGDLAIVFAAKKIDAESLVIGDPDSGTNNVTGISVSNVDSTTGTITGTVAQGPETGWQPRWEREGEILYCPWHGSDFDLCTGRALSRKPLRLQSYPVRVENGTVTITV